MITDVDKSKILSILSEILKRNVDELADIATNSPSTSVGYSSIEFIQFLVSVEEEFDVEIKDSDLLLSYFETYELIYKNLDKYIGKTCESSAIKKVLVCDCDNVLWHGVSGEEQIFIDESILVLHRTLCELHDKGVLICLCSKNEQANINNAFNNLPMKFKKGLVTVEKVNFSNKAINISSIAEELNLSLNSFVFIDDSDYEIGLINNMLPDVETIKVDYSNITFIENLKSLFCDTHSRLDRTTLYKEQKEREKAKSLYLTVEEYNQSLNTVTAFLTNEPNTSMRISELSQRTNQFNLSAAKYTKEEIEQLMSNNNYLVIALSATDKYGDMDIIGACVLSKADDYMLIESFFISCRAFGRDFEKLLLNEVKMISAGKAIYGIYSPTEYNKRFANFYVENGVQIK